MRRQFHFRKYDDCWRVWDVSRLIEQAENLPVEIVALDSIAELDENYWFESSEDVPTVRSIADHASLILAADSQFPVILDPGGKVMDGMHRVARAYGRGHTTIKAKRLNEWPAPDFEGSKAEVDAFVADALKG